jgi:hypothetical protein
MLAVSLVFGSFLAILYLIIGLVIGWVTREYMMNYQDKPKLHPEFFDGNGNVIADEVVAVSFNPDYFLDDDMDDDDDE